MTVETILIAGATGTNGRALIEALRGAPVRLRALVRASSLGADVGEGVETVVGDLADRESLERALEGVDRAYVVTAVQPNTVALFDNFFAAAKQAGVRHVVKFSGLGASTDSPSEVIRQHGASDERLIETGLPYTILRPNSFHQNMLWQAETIARDDRFFLPLADAAQSTIDVRDIAEITARILTEEGHEGRVYDLTGPEGLTFHDVARILGELRGKPVTYQPISVEAAEAAMREAGMSEWHARALAEIQGLFATGAYAEPTPDAARLLGRPPRSFADFARDHIDSFAPKRA